MFLVDLFFITLAIFSLASVLPWTRELVKVGIQTLIRHYNTSKKR